MMKGPIDSGQAESVATLIRNIMPGHTIYCEPWFCEGEVLFLKQPSAHEVINDPDERIVNFYVTLRTRWEELNFLVESTLYSDSLAALADEIYEGRKSIGSLYRAWAVWAKYNKDKVNRRTWLADTALWLSGYRNEKNNLNRHINVRISERLEKVCIINESPWEVIRKFDTEETFFYLRPADRKQAEGLMDVIPDIKGKFIVFYPDRRVMEKMMKKCSLIKETTPDDNMVLANFKRQITLFD